MGEMIGNIAHQWRQPLNSLALNLFAIEKKFHTDAVNKDLFHTFVEESQKTIQHMSTTIDDFRDFFNPNKAKMLFKLSFVIDKTISFVHDSFKNHGITIYYDDKSDLEIFGYENEFAQVLINVFNNSKDAILKKKREGGFIRVAVTHSNENTAIITITDNGGGASDEIINRVFEPYFTTKEKKDGTGIGLYMSKMIIENSMGGFIKMASIPHGMQTEISLQVTRND